MRIKRRRELNIETHQIFVIRPAASGAARCPHCGGRAGMVSLDGAMALSGASSREIHRLIEGGRLHFAETPEGALLVCLHSLMAGRE